MASYMTKPVPYDDDPVSGPPPPRKGAWVRGVRIRPYLEGKGPSFQLHLYDCGYGTGFYDSHKPRVGSRMVQENLDGTKVILCDRTTREAADVLSCWGVDSDKTMAMVLDYRCSREGDLDPDHFKDDTPEIKAFRKAHGEALGLYAFDPEEGGERRNADGTWGEEHRTWPEGWEEIDEDGEPLPAEEADEA